MSPKVSVLVGAVLMGAAVAVAADAAGQPAPPAPGAEKVCLQTNRMMNYDIVDERTLVITDRFFKRYTVRMTSGCVGLTKAATDVVLQRRGTTLGCFGDGGDTVTFISPGLGRLSCIVTGVENYVPSPPKAAD